MSKSNGQRSHRNHNRVPRSQARLGFKLTEVFKLSIKRWIDRLRHRTQWLVFFVIRIAAMTTEAVKSP